MVFINQEDWEKKMDLTPRQAGDALRSGKVPGAVKIGQHWRIPEGAVLNGSVPAAIVPIDVPVENEPIVDDPIVESTDDLNNSESDERSAAEKVRDDAVLKAETARALREAAEDKLATKRIDTELAELEGREQAVKDGEDALVKRAAALDTRAVDIQAREDAIAVKEADIETAAAQIVQATKDKAQGIIGDATLQAGNLINTAKEEASRINEKSKARAKELDKAQADLVATQVKVTNSRAVVERCLSRLDRDAKELLLYPPKDWPGRLKTLIDFVTSSLQDGS